MQETFIDVSFGPHPSSRMGLSAIERHKIGMLYRTKKKADPNGSA